MGDRPLEMLAFGAGVQTTALLHMAIDGALELPRLDRVIFADTGRESPATYRHLAAMQARTLAAGIAFDVVSAGNIRDDTLSAHATAARHKQFATAPFFVRDRSGSTAMLRRQCTSTYKIEPIRRLLWQLVGRRSRPGAVRQWAGISWDESQRVRDSAVAYVVNVYPLIERRLTRRDCVAWLNEHGYAVPPKSACIECPFHDDRTWLAMRQERPDEWAEAVDFDARIRTLPRVTGDVYLHRSCVPLAEARLSPEDHGQLSMLEQLCGAECGV